ncbi:ScbR family autoregulator-binding transcription factor [Streptomyces justiciae]|uniref:ScbR family autoregulator-binding transcription factor n=1 Tax=Streptomyces justiciae TaxID=2780140 RepID=A0ABU3M4L0_9ACTN|nr:ScbR family autoregulator-binding transcription factor [Streptomyces justiciae]MBE8471282.1 TetR/AcrR family transcriptional regulator [Streptomyces justiciae]MCW8377064.1 ScbR family autoregulator-binding transcription factor [Streptomyces justiciae]MDT7846355.1 ScbR family autoregulator-binding transcription factor [Streptomyces justiciae]
MDSMAVERSAARSRPARDTAPRHRDTGLKQERAVRTRGQVLDAAAEAFATQGFPAVTVQDVAVLAGVTKGAVYFHYANKEALAQACAEEFYHRLGVIGQEVEEADLTPLRAVTELLERTARAFRDETMVQAGARLQIERSLIGAEMPMPYLGYTESLTVWLRQAQEAGQLPAGTSPEATARVLVSAFFGAQHISWVLNDRADIADRVQEILTAVVPMATRNAE